MNQVRTIVHCDSAHKHNIFGQNIGIAIVDTGLFSHPDYRSRIIGWCDATRNSLAPYDDSGHGSHVAGIASGDGFLSKTRYTGIAPNANLIGVKVLNRKGNGSIPDIMKGLDWILKNRYHFNIRIVNISIGANDPQTFHENSEFVKYVEHLWDSGLIIVAAAGNKGPHPHSISAPGNSRKIITVGAHDLPPNSHSSVGPTFSCIKKPDVVAPGSRIVSCSSLEHMRKGYPYSVKSGTSMSTPVVSGALALLLSKYPDMTPREVKIRLKQASTDLHLPHENQGWGLLNIEQLL